MKSNILSIDGGGTRGLTAFTLLECIRDGMNIPLTSIFDACIGISIGAIIGALVATGKLDDETLFNKDSLKAIITQVFTDKQYEGPLMATQYMGKGKRKALEQLFGNSTLGSTIIPLSIIIATIDGQPISLSSLNEKHKSILLYEALDASSAAPVFFPPIQMHIPDVQSKLFIDYGAIVANPMLINLLDFSPTVCKQRNTFSNDERHFSVSCISPVHQTRISSIKPEKIGTLAWLANLDVIDVIGAVNDDTHHRICQRLLGDRYLRVVGVVSSRFDDISNGLFDRACQTGLNIWEQNNNRIKEFLNHSPSGS